MSVIFPPAVGFALALALNQNIPGRSPLRALFYLPVIIAPIAVATIWRWMYDPFFGLFNATLTSLGLQGLIRAVQFCEVASILRMTARSRAARHRVFRTLSPPLARMVL